MVGPMPQISRCGSCRRMRVKCDGLKPSCGRCLRAGRECPGYPEPAFISMNSASEDRALRLRFKRSTKCQKLEFAGGSSNGGTSESSDASDASASAIAPTVKIMDWTMPAMCYFFQHYTFPADSPHFKGGYLDFLPSMCAKQSIGTAHLREAVKAASLASYAAYCHLNDVTLQARMAYGRSLRLIRLSLDDPRMATSDETLLTTYILSKYELITGEKPNLWESHGAGQLQMIRLRGASILWTPAASHIYRFMYVRQQVKDIALRRMPTVQLIAGSDPAIATQSLFPAGLGFAVVMLFKDITYAVARAQQIFDEAQLATSDLNDTNASLISSFTDCLDLDVHLANWAQSATSVIPYTTLADKNSAEIPDHYRTDAVPSNVNLFGSISHAIIWCRLWCGRLYIFQILLEHLALLKSCGLLPYNVELEMSFSEGLLAVVDNLCASAPYLFGDIDELGKRRTEASWTEMGSFIMIWFLHLAASVDTISDKKFDWLCGRLAHIGHTSLRQGLVLRDRCIARREGRAIEVLSTW